tara:strand:+ start:683 stop:1873 length:1191 start_codon:yes stop_codon:yes gene_type:complete
MKFKPHWKLLVALLLVFDFIWGNEDVREDYKSVDLSQLDLLEDCAVRTSKNSLIDNKFLAIVRNSDEISLDFESFYWLRVSLKKTEFWVRSTCVSSRKSNGSCPLYYDEELKKISPYYVFRKEYIVLVESDSKKKIKLKHDFGFMGSQCFGLPMMYSEKFKSNYDKVYQPKVIEKPEPTFVKANDGLFRFSYSPLFYDFHQSDSKENSNEFRLFLTNSFGLSYQMTNENVSFEAGYEYKEVNFKNDLLGTKYLALNTLSINYLRNRILPSDGGLGILVRSEQSPYFLNVDNSTKNYYYSITNAGPRLVFQHTLYDINFASSWFVFQSIYSHNWQAKTKLGFEVKLNSVVLKKESLQYDIFVRYINQSVFLTEKIGINEVDLTQQIKSTIFGFEISY